MLRARINVTLTARGRGRRAGGRLSVLIGHRRLHVAGLVRIDPPRRWTLAHLIVSELGEPQQMLVHLLFYLFHPQPEMLGPVRERRSEQSKPQRLDYGVTASPGKTIEEQRVLHRATPQQSLEKVTSSSLVRPARTLGNVGILSRDYCNSTTFKGRVRRHDVAELSKGRTHVGEFLRSDRPFAGSEPDYMRWGRRVDASHLKPWCPEEDSNLHGFHHWYLKPARLPIPPSGLRPHT